MSDAFREKLLDECRNVAENSLYNAQAHFFIAARCEHNRFLWVIFPALLVGFAAFVAAFALQIPWLSQYKTAIDAFVAFGGLVIALTSFLNYDKQASTHIRAAGTFTMLRHEAKSLCDTFALKLNDDELKAKVECLLKEYAYLIQSTEPTDEKSFQKARKQIQKGFHEMDYKQKPPEQTT